MNLLLILRLLLQENSVTGTAARLGVTQSAVSHSLAKLRKVLDDQLLVRTSKGLQPTPRARDILPRLERAFDELDEILAPEVPFAPATARARFRLLATDYAEVVVLPPLIQQLRRTAPGVDVVVQPREATFFEAVESGNTDLVIGMFNNAPGGIFRQALFSERLACVVRVDHPEASEPLSLETFLALDHALISPRGGPRGLVDRALAAKGLERRIALIVPHFLVAPLVVAETDLLLVLPERIARRFAALMPLRVLEPPLELPGFTVSQIWHERMHGDPAHKWFRAAVSRVAENV